jgi:hypothetical protein
VIRKTILSAVLSMSLTLPTMARAEYQFDDVYGPSGVGAQWMVVEGEDMDTGGDATARAPVDAQGDLVLSRQYIRIANGKGLSPSPNGEGWPIHTMFLVMPGRESGLRVSFDWIPQVPSNEVVTVDVNLDNTSYQMGKSIQAESGVTARLFNLSITKKLDAGSYGSVRGNFIFHQNPNDLPSQTLQVPFIIANVYNGTAEGKPLSFGATLRETVTGSSTGDIVAFDRFEWNAVDDKTVGTDNDWVFVPVSKLPIDSNTLNYRLSTEVTNYSGIRYALQRFDGYTAWPLTPSRWAFDIPRAEDVPQNLYLDELSHIPPGLVTTYNHSFNVVSGVRESLHLYPVDPTDHQDGTAAGFRTLTLAHRSIFGLGLGTPIRDSGNPGSYSVTGFQLLSAGIDFLNEVGSAMSVTNVGMPEPSDGVMGGSVSYAYVAGDAIASFGVNAGVPSRMTGRGLLPLHVTFNLPRTNQLVYPRWDALLREWRSTGDIRDLFASSFGIYMQDAFGNNLDLTEWLKDRNAWDRTVKVFLDEQRNVLTVSFVVMLLDGAKATVRVVEDTTVATRHSYIVATDGNANGKWDMKFFVAPAGYVPTDRRETEEGGSGCNMTTFGALLLLSCVSVLLKRR